MLTILCVNNARKAAPDKESTNNPAKELQNEEFNLEMKGNFTEHLGIRMEHRDDGTIHMTRKGSIEKIIATAKMKECSWQ